MPEQPKNSRELDEQIALLQGRIAPLQAELNELLEFRRYAERFKDKFQVVPIAETTALIRAAIPPPVKQPSRQAVMLDACREILSDGRPRTTREILHELGLRGIQSMARDKRANLASLMSHSGRFIADKKRGWTLPKSEKAKADDVPASPAFSSNGASPGHSPLAGSPREGGFQFG